MTLFQSAPKLTVITYVPEPFSVQSAGDAFTTALTAGAVGALTGGLGGALVGLRAESTARSEGDKWVQAYALSDPAAEVRGDFIAALSGLFNLPPLDIVSEVVAGDDIKKLQEKFGEVAILDFKTDNWRLDPGPMTGFASRLVRRAR